MPSDPAHLAGMQIRLSPEQFARLAEIAARGGRSAEQIAAEAVRRFLEEDRRFTEAVRLGIEAADRGDFVTADEVGPDLQRQSDPAMLLQRVRAIQTEIASKPVLDPRTPDEIVGYNKQGHFD